MLSIYVTYDLGDDGRHVAIERNTIKIDLPVHLLFSVVRLSELLRLSLDNTGEQEVAPGREINFIERDLKRD